MKVNYEIVGDYHDALVIKDLGPWDKFMTITNAAEDVVENLKERLAGRRLFYYDSEGNLDELVIENGTFKNFAPGSR